MQTPISNLSVLIASMEPVLNDGTYAFASVPHGTATAHIPAVATMREAEGMTLVMAEQLAQEMGLAILFRCAWITLNVHSDLNAVGLTAAFAKALGDAGISCNVVAGAYHDHLFVPVDAAARAMAALQQLQQSAFAT
ncbi:MAG: ACT domain-containing protein [Rhodoferax sp.]|nr:ACT domain-containing protein [Rhodoferax sp.]